MTVSYPSALCAEVEGLLCLSDLPELEMQQLLCSAEDPCLHFFQGMGFRPAAWAKERDQYGDRMILIVSGDDAYYAKYDMPFNALGFLPLENVLPLPGPAVPIPALLATPGGAPAGFSFGGVAGFPGFPGFLGSPSFPGFREVSDSSDRTPVVPDQSLDTTTPGRGGQTGDGNQDLPPLTPVPLSGSSLFLVLALVALMVTAARRGWSGRLSAGS